MLFQKPAFFAIGTAFRLACQGAGCIRAVPKYPVPNSQNTKNSLGKATTGHKLVIAREQIQSLRASPLSLMPEGLLDSFNDQQIRDLISYVTQKK